MRCLLFEPIVVLTVVAAEPVTVADAAIEKPVVVSTAIAVVIIPLRDVGCGTLASDLAG